MEKAVRSLEEFEREAQDFIRTLVPGKEVATLVTLSGELGAGKTAFVKAAAKALGVEEHITSPTFVLEKIYALSAGPFSKLIHIDAYRLKNGSELAALGFDECMKDSQNLIMLEWPEQVADALPIAHTHLMIEVYPDGSRHIQYA